MKKNVFDHTLLTVPDLLCQWQTSHRSQVAGIRVEEYTKSSQITHKPLCSTSWIFRAFILRASGLACKEAAKLKLPAHVSGLQNPSSPGNGCQREEAAWSNLLHFSREEPSRMLPRGLWWVVNPTQSTFSWMMLWIWELVATTWPCWINKQGLWSLYLFCLWVLGCLPHWLQTSLFLLWALGHLFTDKR